MELHGRRQLKSVTLLACVLVLTLMAVCEAAANEAREETELEVVRFVTTAPTEVPADWPIVRTERTEQFDVETGTEYVEVLIVRHSPMSSSALADDANCVEAMPSANCVKTGGASFYLYGTRSSANGWITSHVNHWTDVICNGTDCVYRKPTKIEAWWTRSGTNWHASDAFAGWGCYGCLRCDGGTWQNVWIESPAYTPSWQNSTTSYTYVYTSDSYPGLYPYDGSTDRASMDSDAYEGWIFRGHMSVNPGFG
jgi:hypothetical protein